MDRRAKIKIIFSPKATTSIEDIAIYLAEKGYPETALKFKDMLYAFGDSLYVFPDKFPVCRYKSLARYNYRCAVFHENYIFIYKVSKTAVVIINVVHTSLLR